MNELNNITSNWSNKVTISLPTYNQIDSVIKDVGTTDYTYTCCGGVVFNKLYSNALWLYDYLGQNNANSIVHTIDGKFGYWTSTPSDAIYAFLITNEGVLQENSLYIPYGIRPVITVSKKIISQ